MAAESVIDWLVNLWFNDDLTDWYSVQCEWCSGFHLNHVQGSTIVYEKNA